MCSVVANRNVTTSFSKGVSKISLEGGLDIKEFKEVVMALNRTPCAPAIVVPMRRPHIDGKSVKALLTAC